jgi:very-short-patch-repair endonuclease
MTKLLEEKLNNSRKELLDLSLRNRLLNVPRSRSRTRTIEIVDELSNEIFRILVREKKAMSFLPGREDTNVAEIEEGEDTLDDLPQPEDEDLDDRGIARRHSDTRLQTRLTSKGLQRRLLEFYYDARTFYEEQGVNILFLAVGMLKWYEADSSGTARYAPLLLLPVSLERESASERFKLRISEEDLTSNLSLLTKMYSEFNLKLPELPDMEDLIPSDYFNQVASACSGISRWEVCHDDMVLGFFSFAKLLMYKDLDAATWPPDYRLENHSILGALLQEGFKAEPACIGDDEKIDPHVAPIDLVQVVDADSSQTVCIEEIKRGRNLVIQGPPGTGKSQTISNLIASAVKHGKSVLFVAEKMAALEVVKRRLDAIELGDICLELHSNKANKREMLDELQRTISLGRPNAGNVAEVADNLQRKRDALNLHCHILNTRLEPSALTPFRIIGHLLRLKNAGARPADFELGNPEVWSATDFRERKAMVLDVAERITETGLPCEHPWRGVALDAILPMDITRLGERLPAYRERIMRLVDNMRSLSKLFEITIEDESFDDIAKLALVGIHSAAAPSMDRQSILHPVWQEQHKAISELINAGELCRCNQEKLSGVVIDAAWGMDLGEARRNLAAYGKSWFRWFNGAYRKAQAALAGITVNPPPKNLQDRLDILDLLAAGQSSIGAVRQHTELGQQAFGSKWNGEKSDWSALKAIEAWEQANRDAGLLATFKEIFVRCNDSASAGMQAKGIETETTVLLADIKGLFREVKLNTKEAFGIDDLEQIPIPMLLDRLNNWHETTAKLAGWVTFHIRARKADEAGLSALVTRLYDGRMKPESAVLHFEMAYYEGMLRHIIKNNPELSSFDGRGHERLIEEFRLVDRKRVEVARAEVLQKHYESMPHVQTGSGGLGILQREIAKKRRNLPIRQLFKHAGSAIQAIKPVFMMSPLSVAQFLEPGAVRFDLLVIDEASQVRPVDALGAIARARQIVVVGDQMQLPPTRFFSKLLEDETNNDEDETAFSTGDLESILGLCTAQGVSQRMLRWHYRSRHHSLIAVSNREFYRDQLFVVPSPLGQSEGLGVRFHYFPDGVFESGGSGTNPKEAKALAKAVIEHARNHPDQTLGVGTFSVRQRQAILNELEHLWRTETDVADYFSSHPHEPFFVKNLENIQGDERDVIFISIGYGKNQSGYMAMRFGPLSSEGGERRLNVLISRARNRCEVFSSITADDIDLERGKGRGVAALKTFLNYAQTGILGTASVSGREMDSPFEEEVFKELTSLGYQVEAQIGIAGFFIDLAIVDPACPGRFLLGIECDGATYHSSRSARDRDRLRQQVLEDHGWIIHRIWSVDWFQRPHEELKKTVAAIEAAKAKWATRNISCTQTTKPIKPEALTIKRTDEVIAVNGGETLTVPYQQACFSIPTGQAPHEVTTNFMATVVDKIVEIEGPIHEEEIARRVSELWGLSRTGNRIVSAVQRGLQVAVHSGSIGHGSPFFYKTEQLDIPVRNRENVTSANLRKPEMLPPSEIMTAIKAVVGIHFGMRADEVIAEVSRLFGFKSTSSQLRQVIQEQLQKLIESGILTERDAVIQLAQR